MNFASIRWRLPASYAAVALLAALALGSLMLLVLNGYYSGLEHDYLQGNAEAARPVVEQILQSGLPVQALQDQIKGLSFLTQAEIRVLDGSGKALANSGIPDANQAVSLSGSPQGSVVLSLSGGATAAGVVVQSGSPGAGGAVEPPVLQCEGAGGVVTGAATTGAPAATTGGPPTTSGGPATTTTGPGLTDRVDTHLTVNASPLGYGFSSVQPVAGQRSAQVVSVPLLSRPGSLEISHGPAYGADILRSVALAWLLASLAAVVVAGLAGMFASRQVTQPVLALTEAARRMQYDDLSIRAALGRGRQTLEFSTLADTFNQMAQRVEDTVSTLRAFVSDAAHELNTPLTALHTNLELAQNEPDGGQRQLFLERAVAQNARLERLASGLLDLSRLGAAQIALDFETLDWAALAAECGARFASRAEQAERDFTLDLTAEPLPVRGSALQLQRLMDNLLENALKFTPPGGTIHMSLVSQAGQAVLSVADSGIGIPAEDLPHLFERFHRGRNSAEYPGTGLGLAIVKAIVELHGGQVEALSASPGQGSQFYVRLAIIST